MTAGVHGDAVSPDGRRVAAGLSDRKILVWGIPSGELLATYDLRVRGVLALAFTADGRPLVAGCGDGSVRVGGLPARYPNETPAPSGPAARPSPKTPGPQ